MSLTDPREAVGDDYVESESLRAQALTWQAIHKVAGQLHAGHTEADAKVFLKQVLSEMGGSQKWHPPQIRFGRNTTQPFGKPSDASVVLQKNDIFFLDIGPVFHGYEGDAGATFVIGDDAEMKRLVDDSKIVYDEVRAHWQSTGASGPDLYAFAQDAAAQRGWRLALEGASGHRIGDFPHSVHHRGKLKTFDQTPSPNRWILEIHLRHLTKELGAFYEDIM